MRASGIRGRVLGRDGPSQLLHVRLEGSLTSNARHLQVLRRDREDEDLLATQEVLEEHGPLVEGLFSNLRGADRPKPILEVVVLGVLPLESLLERFVRTLQGELLLAEVLQASRFDTLVELGLGEATVRGGEVDPELPFRLEELPGYSGERACLCFVQRIAQDSRLALLGVREGILEVPLVSREAAELELGLEGLVVDLGGAGGEGQL